MPMNNTSIYLPHLEKEKRAIKVLQAFEPPDEPYYVCYSGGKDSDVIKILSDLAGVKHETHHNLTTVDAPETVHYIKAQSDIIIDRPQKSMWQLIAEKKVPPTRLVRYCCAELKERGGKGRVKVTGVRWDESNNRKENSGTVNIIGKPKTVRKTAEELNANFISTKKGGVVLNDDNDESRRLVEQCYRTTSTMVNPIIEWTNTDVWNFLNYYGCKSNPLYYCGFGRIGCIGCPMAGKHRYSEFARYPKYKLNYIRAFDRMLENIKASGADEASLNWKTGEDVFAWWMGENTDQLKIDDSWWII